MIKVPGYNFDTRPYVLLKDSRFISLIDVFSLKVIPLIRSPYEGEPMSIHNFHCLQQNEKDDQIDH